MLALVEAKGIPSFPSWTSFQKLKSKLEQKKFLLQSKIPSSPFLPVSPWTKAADDFVRENKGAVLKAGRGGYDGKGVWLIDTQGRTSLGEKASEVAARIEQPYLEQKVPFSEEIAAVVCRSASGEVELYPTVRSLQVEGICFQVEFSKDFANSKTARRAGAIARQIAEKLQYVGVLAVEFFVVGEEVLVNEIAPRVHNSGHFTIDVCAGSQFENHLRAGLGMPLARTEPTHAAAVMVNLLWPPSEKEFAPLFAKLSCGPAWPENAKLHWYGKSEIRPRRKMGHFTVYGQSLAECRETARQILASRWVQG
jgi:5-(carboxyamino)imidazole ribonucleotide synthase